MAIGVLPGVMTPEFGDVLLYIDAVALALFVALIFSAKIAAGSSRVSKLLGLPLLAERFRLWRAAHKGR